MTFGARKLTTFRKRDKKLYIWCSVCIIGAILVLTQEKITCKTNQPDKQTINQHENKLRYSRKGKLIISFQDMLNSNAIRKLRNTSPSSNKGMINQKSGQRAGLEFFIKRIWRQASVQAQKRKQKADYRISFILQMRKER